jgi:hypothetical protein
MEQKIARLVARIEQYMYFVQKTIAPLAKYNILKRVVPNCCKIREETGSCALLLIR